LDSKYTWFVDANVSRPLCHSNSGRLKKQGSATKPEAMVETKTANVGAITRAVNAERVENATETDEMSKKTGGKVRARTHTKCMKARAE
jgi:hypothetical protein